MRKSDQKFKNDETVMQENATGERFSVSIKWAVLKRLDDAVGLGLGELLNDLRGVKSSRRSFSRGTIFEDSDIQFEERVKHLGIVCDCISRKTRILIVCSFFFLHRRCGAIPRPIGISAE